MFRNARARALAFGDLCELTGGRAKFARDRGVSLAEADRLLAVRDFRPALPLGLAFDAAKASPVALLRFGSMLEDLECHVDNSLLRDGSGAIVGRRAGIKGWLVENLPALAQKYKTVMAYKAAARRMRQVAGLSDPTPLSDALPPEGAADEKAGGAEFRDYGADEIHVADGAAAGVADAAAGVAVLGAGVAAPKAEVAILRARAVCLEVLEQVGRGARRTTAMARRLDELTSPDRVEDANMLRSWREKYECEITVRTRDIWAKRLGRQLEKWAG